MNKLTIGFSGANSSGKTTLSRYTFVEYINQKVGKKRFVLQQTNGGVVIIDTFNHNNIVGIDDKLNEAYSVKIYNFDDPIKQFCINSFGLDYSQCYGSDDDMHSQTHLVWENLPDDIREKHSKPKRGNSGLTKPASGFMNSNEVLHVFEHDICTRIDSNTLARGLYNLIKKDGYELAIIQSVYEPNQVTIGTENHAKIVKLQRKNDTHHESVMDEFPLGEFTLVIDNTNTNIDETNNILKPHLKNWFNQSKIL